MQLKKETTVGLFIVISISSFLFMSYRIGFFKFDKLSYVHYTAHLKTVNGLTRKAEVRIAGVKIGWIDSLDIAADDCYVDAKLMISKKYKLYADSQIFIRQDGPLGAKFIEINPGHSDKPILSSSDIISDLDKPQYAMDDVLGNVASVMETINQFTNMLKGSLNSDNIKSLTTDVSSVITKLSTLSKSLEHLLITNFGDSLEEVKCRIPKVLQNAEQMITNVSSASESVKAVADKINNATNLISGDKNFFSKIGTESNQPFLNNLSSRVENVLYCLDKISNVTIGLDNNYEFLMNQNYNKNFKSLFNLWVHPSDRYFFIGGVNFSKNGFVKRSVKVLKDNQDGIQLVNTSKIKKNTFGLNLQAGGYFKNFILRVGLFESTPGFALDYLVPFRTNKFKWISTFEAFDFTGKNKVYGFKYNPHLKWMNRVYFSPNFYLTFGIDDFANQEKRFGFLGLGLNFGGTYFRNLFS